MLSGSAAFIANPTFAGPSSSTPESNPDNCRHRSDDEAEDSENRRQDYCDQDLEVVAESEQRRKHDCQGRSSQPHRSGRGSVSDLGIFVLVPCRRWSSPTHRKRVAHAAPNAGSSAPRSRRIGNRGRPSPRWLKLRSPPRNGTSDRRCRSCKRQRRSGQSVSRPGSTTLQRSHNNCGKIPPS